MRTNRDPYNFPLGQGLDEKVGIAARKAEYGKPVSSAASPLFRFAAERQLKLFLGVIRPG
jgi:hypothetical protein